MVAASFFTKRCLSALLLLIPMTGLHAVADREIQAKETALTWLALIDEGKYAEALDQADPHLRESIERQAWVDGLTQVRKPLGQADSRRLLRLFATTLLPEAPEGDYVVVNFRTRYALREDPMNEIIVLSAQEDTPYDNPTWKVIGFYLE